MEKGYKSCKNNLRKTVIAFIHNKNDILSTENLCKDENHEELEKNIGNIYVILMWRRLRSDNTWENIELIT